MLRKLLFLTFSVTLLFSVMALAQGNPHDDDEDSSSNSEKAASNNCQELPSAATLQAQLTAAPAMPSSDPSAIGGDVGGLFGGSRMWAAVVNRSGELCSFVTSTSDPTQVWPGSQAIAKAKAFTANAFSLDSLPLPTARLYTLTQPGHSLWSLGQANPFDPAFLATPEGRRGGKNQLAGGMIFFGGGVPLYSNNGTKVVGALGVSGDTSCADHEVAKRVRHLLNMNPAGGPMADDIQYSAVDPPSAFIHPQCLNVKRNGVTIGTGTEANAVGY